MNPPERKRARGPNAEFIGPRRRGRIIAAVSSRGWWRGRRGPMRIIIRHDRQPTLEGACISFHASIFRDGVNGQAGTVAEVIDKLEILYRERTLKTRPPKPKPKRERRPKG